MNLTCLLTSKHYISYSLNRIAQEGKLYKYILIFKQNMNIKYFEFAKYIKFKKKKINLPYYRQQLPL